MLASLAAAPAAQQPTGGLHLVFTDRSPLSPMKEMARRPTLVPMAPDAEKLEYDLARESFEAFVPPAYRPQTPFGLFVFISADKAEVPSGWLDVLARRKLILVSANNSGNGRTFPIRIGLALDAVHNLAQHYNIDPARVYIGGFSGGAGAASIAVTAFPDVFKGGYFMMGGVMFYGVRATGPDTFESTVLAPDWTGDVDDLKKNLRLVIMTGQDDAAGRPPSRVSYQSLYLDAFERSYYFEIPHYGHMQPDATWFEKGLAALESAQPNKPPTTAPTKSSRPDPAQIAQARRYLATALLASQHRKTAEARKHAQTVIDDYPTTASAAQARELLKKLDAPTSRASSPPRTR